MCKLEYESGLLIINSLFVNLSNKINETVLDDKIRVSLFYEEGNIGYVFENFTKNTKVTLFTRWDNGNLVLVHRTGYIVRLDPTWLDKTSLYLSGQFSFIEEIIDSAIVDESIQWLLTPGFDMIST